MTGCAGGWETLTSHRFRDGLLEHPYATVRDFWIPEDPMLILRTTPLRDPDERALAMQRLKEPIRNNGTQEDQDVIINILAKTAKSDSSPVLRLEAIGALGRFQDPRVASILMSAYQTAHGRRAVDPEPPRPEPVALTVGLSAGRAPTALGGKSTATDWTRSPIGFQPDWVAAIRCRIAETLGRTGRDDAADFLAAIAGGAGQDVAPEGSEDRDVKLAAVRGLGQCRNPRAVLALAQVLNRATSVNPSIQDTAMIGRTTEGLVRLTGKKLPPDPQQWNEVVQAPIVIAPEPGWWENTIVQVSAWIKD
jgi:HEAT repeat protein